MMHNDESTFSSFVRSWFTQNIVVYVYLDPLLIANRFYIVLAYNYDDGGWRSALSATRCQGMVSHYASLLAYTICLVAL